MTERQQALLLLRCSGNNRLAKAWSSGNEVPGFEVAEPGGEMRIGIVGGAERIEARLRSVAHEGGHVLEFHPGHMNGTGSKKLEAIVDRCDLLVVVTEVNSHAAVLQARDLARKTGCPLRLIRRLGTAQLRAMLN